MDDWVNCYREVIGFSLYQHFDDKDISTEYSALMSKVMANGNGVVKFPINEPATGKRKNPRSRNISNCITAPACSTLRLRPGHPARRSPNLREQGVEFPRVPSSYYRELEERMGKINEPLAELEQLASSSTAMTGATCSKSSPRRYKTARRSFSRSSNAAGKPAFGKGNFKALFEAIEREQQARGNL